MKNNADKEIGVLTAVFEQNWLHIRQKENERIWITNIYVLIVAGALSFLKFSNHINLYVVPFLLILSILNFFFHREAECRNQRLCFSNRKDN